VLAVKQMKKAIPAEMIQIPVKAASIHGNQEIEVSVVC
jgi:hypothetical protein